MTMTTLPFRYPSTSPYVVIDDDPPKRDFADHFGAAMGFTIGCIGVLALLLVIASLVYALGGAVLIIIAAFFGPALIYSTIMVWRDRR